MELIVDVEVLNVSGVVLVLDFDPGVLVERHGEVTVEGCSATEFLLF